MSDQTTLASLSSALEAVVAAARPAIVSVHSRRSRATGFVWKTGLVVTADEALAEEGDVTIVLADGTTRPATIAGRDHTTDIALLRFDGAGLTPARLSSGVPVLGSLAVVVAAQNGSAAARWRHRCTNRARHSSAPQP
jgi:S1-C subfamily serine protease